MLRGTPRTPFRFTVPAAIAGFVFGWVLGGLLGWEQIFAALGGCLLAQVVLDAWWSQRS